MIAHPIGDPIGFYRAYPNRPRIAQYESSRVVPKNVKTHPSVTGRATQAPFVLSAVVVTDGWLQ